MEHTIGEETLFKCCRCKKLLRKENFHKKAYNKNHGIQYKCKLCLKEIYRTNALKNKYTLRLKPLSNIDTSNIDTSNIDTSKTIPNTSVFERLLKR